MAEQNWVIQMKRADFNALSEQFHIDPVVARILVNRGVPEDKFAEFLNPTVDTMHSPFLLEDINQAVRILIHDMEEGHKVRIVSDYDVDGIMSNVILYKGFKKAGIVADYVVPHRIKDGYGINEDIVEAAAADGVHTIVTCDNGIAAVDAIAKAKELGMTVIITDHHDIPFEIKDGEKHYILPQADAILNPKKETCSYPFKDLCGAGVAYKLVEALYEKREIPKEEVQLFLEFVAMATICDVVSLQDENRAFVVNGLKQLNYTRNCGLRALISANELSDLKLDAYHVSFRLGPCLNAAGRLETAEEAIDLLLEEDIGLALGKAQHIKSINDERRELTEQGVEQAEEYLRNAPEMKVFVIYLPECHESLAGIIAGRIREKYHHPVLVVVDAEEKGMLKGSGRSIEEYQMVEALQECEDILSKYGGHAMAAGFSLPAENLDSFRERLNANCGLLDDAFIPKVKIDVPMPISYVTEELIEEIDSLAPFGKGNETPVFAQKNVNLLSAKIMGKDRNVIKFTMETSDGAIGEGIYFNVPEISENIINWFGQEEYDKLLHGWLNNVVLNIVYYPSINEFNGNKTIQFRIKRYSMATVREML